MRVKCGGGPIMHKLMRRKQTKKFGQHKGGQLDLEKTTICGVVNKYDEYLTD